MRAYCCVAGAVEIKGSAHLALKMNATTLTLHTSHLAMLAPPRQVTDLILCATRA